MNWKNGLKRIVLLAMSILAILAMGVMLYIILCYTDVLAEFSCVGFFLAFIAMIYFIIKRIIFRFSDKKREEG